MGLEGWDIPEIPPWAGCQPLPPEGIGSTQEEQQRLASRVSRDSAAIAPALKDRRHARAADRA